MKIKKINHLGIASKLPTECFDFLTQILNLKLVGQDTVQEQHVQVDMLEVGESRLELLRPTSPESTIEQYLNKKGSGIHHIALEVDNLEKWIEYLKEKNVRLIHDSPQPGAHNTKIVFIHPHSTGGILVELVEELTR